MRRDSVKPVLLDTNVLVYAVDAREQVKARLAAVIVRRAVEAEAGVVTPQVIAEFFDVTTRSAGGMPSLLSRATAASVAYDLLASCRCLDMTPLTTAAALNRAVNSQMRIFDAQIWAAAKLNGIKTILSEDTQGQPVVEGVRYIDPFRPSFRLAQLGL